MKDTATYLFTREVIKLNFVFLTIIIATAKFQRLETNICTLNCKVKTKSKPGILFFDVEFLFIF